MPRSGAGVYSLPNPAFVPDTPISSAVMNGNLADLVSDANAARPISAGGTGADNPADALAALGGISGITPVFKDDVFFLVDNADATKKLQFQMSAVATATIRTWTVPDASGTVLLNSVTATITAGFTVTPKALGNVASFTVNPVLGNYQAGTNHAAATWTAPTTDCAVDILLTNDATAGAVTFSGFTVGAVVGDPLDTVSGHKFLISIRRIAGISTYMIKALQ